MGRRRSNTEHVEGAAFLGADSALSVPCPAAAVESDARPATRPRPRLRLLDYVELTKPRVVLMVLITTVVGFYLGSDAATNPLLLLPTLAGTALAAAGTLALNQFLERDTDALMERTRRRPLPDGRLLPMEAACFGVLLTAAGIGCLWLAVNALSAAVTATISLTYLFLYTPLKRYTPFCSVVGAVPGALPPVIGWTATRDGLGIEAGVLFSILFLWQLPHSLAIARLYRDDYARGGIRLLPVVEEDARSTGIQIVSNCLALLAVGLLPSAVGLAGPAYLPIAFVLGAVFLGYGVSFARTRTVPAARQLLVASLIYLPALLFVMALDKAVGSLLFG
ncbi:heme o synthase [Candidatus Binatia bacterium]|nr:heme o synthase [Candidatus Binatia bacterium]